MSNTTDHPDHHHRPLAAIILAAGQGTRMESDLPKVAHKVAGKSMVEWVAEASKQVGADPIVIVVGYKREVVEALFENDNSSNIEFVLQEKQLGTANAVDAARETLQHFDGDVLVLCGDGPLIRAETLQTILKRHRDTAAAATLATSTVNDPKGYGRIVRDSKGYFQAIVEQKNLDDSQQNICEINPSYYCFDSRKLFDALTRVERNEVSDEYYVTDVPALLKADNEVVEVIDAVPPQDVLSINTPKQLAEVDVILSARLEGARS